MTSTPFYEFPYSQPIQGRGSGTVVTFIRPTNTTSYTAADVIGAADTVTPANAGSAIFEFVGAGRAGGVFQVQGATCTINSTTVPTGMTTLKLHLFNASPTAILENAPFALLAADRTRYLAQLDLPAVVAVGGGFVRSVVEVANERSIVLTGTSVFGLLVTDSAVTSPASGLEFRLQLFLQEIA
jgi:hypothetical protein